MRRNEILVLLAFSLGIMLTILFTVSEQVSAAGQGDSEGDADDFTRKVMEWEEKGIDPNHTEAIENIRAYIDSHMDKDTFASLHIDREERDLGVIVLSFTSPVADEHEQALTELAEDPVQITFHQVDYTEEELLEKQNQIDMDAFEDEGITIHHMGVDVIENRVEVGIDPLNEETAQIIYDTYGDEMIQVVQGYEVILLEEQNVGEDEMEEQELGEDESFHEPSDDESGRHEIIDDEADIMPAATEENETLPVESTDIVLETTVQDVQETEELNFLQKIGRWISNLWNGLWQ
jgi:hypothetical protein